MESVSLDLLKIQHKYHSKKNQAEAPVRAWAFSMGMIIAVKASP